MDFVQPEPELAGQLSKAHFILVPTEIEVLGAVLPSLEHCPPPSVCSHVAVHFETSFAIRIDKVLTISGDASFVVFRTISSRDYGKKEKPTQVWFTSTGEPSLCLIIITRGCGVGGKREEGGGGGERGERVERGERGKRGEGRGGEGLDMKMSGMLVGNFCIFVLTPTRY